MADGAPVQEGEERLDLPHDFTARAIGIEDLVEKTKEGTSDRVDVLATVRTFVALGQQPGGQKRAKEEVQMQQALLAQVLDAAPQGAELGAPGGEEGSGHIQYIYCIY